MKSPLPKLFLNRKVRVGSVLARLRAVVRYDKLAKIAFAATIVMAVCFLFVPPRPVSAIDQKINDALYPKGLMTFDHQPLLAVSLEMMSLPSTMTIDKFEQYIDEEIKSSHARRLSPRQEYQFILRPETEISNVEMRKRMALVSRTLHFAQMRHPQIIGSSVEYPEWHSPFQILVD